MARNKTDPGRTGLAGSLYSTRKRLPIKNIMIELKHMKQNKKVILGLVIGLALATAGSVYGVLSNGGNYDSVQIIYPAGYAEEMKQETVYKQEQQAIVEQKFQEQVKEQVKVETKTYEQRLADLEARVLRLETK